MKNKPFPEVLRRKFHNWRFYKALKRMQMRRLIKALDEFNMGCAWIPDAAYTSLVRARRELDRTQQLICEKEWGR